MKWLNRFIVDHENFFIAAFIIGMLLWFVLGLIFVDTLHPVVFIVLWGPPAILDSFFAYYW